MGLKYVGSPPSGPNDPVRLQDLTGLKASTVTVQPVITGSEARPTGFQTVIWLGGATRPVNMADGDIWLSTAALSTPTAPTITTTTLNSMVVGTPFSQTLATTGTTPMTFTIVAATPVPGLNIDVNTGVISGTPTTAGPYDVTVTAHNSVGDSSPRRYQGTVGAAGTAPTITTTTLPSMTQNSAYDSGALVVTGSTPITFGVSAGTLPAGLSINSSTGAISGTPTGPGAYNFTVQGANAFGNDTQQFTGTITAAGVVQHTIFGSTTPPFTLASYNDGGTDSYVAHQFYITASPARAWKVKGVRVYVPVGSSLVGRTGFIAVARGVPLTLGGTIPGTNWYGSNMASNGSKTAMGRNLDVGWNDFLLSATYDFNSNEGLLAGYSVNGGYYMHASTGESNVIQSVDGVNMYLAEMGGDSSSVMRSYFAPSGSAGASTTARWYGIDIIVSES